MIIFNDEYIEKVKVGIMIITAKNFDLRLMLLCSFQSRINGPKSLWLISQFSRNDDDLEKNHALSNKNGVVGIPGIMIPIKPKQTNRDPKPMNKYFLINFLAYLNQSVDISISKIPFSWFEYNYQRVSDINRYQHSQVCRIHW